MDKDRELLDLEDLRDLPHTGTDEEKWNKLYDNLFPGSRIAKEVSCCTFL